MKKILLDMDGVIVDFVRGCMELHNKPNPYLDGSFTDFFFEKAWNMQPEEFWQGMDRKFWANLKWTNDGRSIFNLLHSIFGPDHICILTSPCSNDGCFDGKMDWIRKWLPKEYHRKFLVGPAKEFCASENTVLIDDYDGNVEKFEQFGGRTILVPRLWNKARKYASCPVSTIYQQIPYVHNLM